MDENVLIAITSAVAGGVITYFCSLLLNIQKSKNTILEKIIEKKIAGLDELLLLSKEMRMTINTNRVNANNAPETYPQSMSNHDEYIKFKCYYLSFTNLNSHWLSGQLSQELMLFQDYLLNVENLLHNNPDLKEKMSQMGSIIKEDFKYFADRIEVLILKSYKASYLRRIALPKKCKSTRYEKEKSITILENTLLIKNYDKIIDLSNE